MRAGYKKRSEELTNKAGASLLAPAQCSALFDVTPAAVEISFVRVA